MIALQLTDDQANLMFHVLGEMPLKHALPLFEALNNAVARSRQEAKAAAQTMMANERQILQAAHAIAPDPIPLSADPPPPSKAPPKGLRVARS